MSAWKMFYWIGLSAGYAGHIERVAVVRYTLRGERREQVRNGVPAPAFRALRLQVAYQPGKRIPREPTRCVEPPDMANSCNTADAQNAITRLSYRRPYNQFTIS